MREVTSFYLMRRTPLERVGGGPAGLKWLACGEVNLQKRTVSVYDSCR
jgi:hypothetical protein